MNEKVTAPDLTAAAPKMCRCGKNEAREPHTCPYAEEINDDSTTLCDCCEACSQECAWDI